MKVTRRNQFHLFLYVTQFDWLRDVGVKTGRKRAFAFSEHSARRYCHDRQATEMRIVPQFSNDAEAVLKGHLQIQEHQGRLILANQVNRVSAVDRFNDDMTGCFEQFSHQLPAKGIVVGNQDC